jgi:hypothetical protein
LRELEGFVRLGLTDAEVRVYLVLRSYDHVNARGETKGLVWPSVPTLAEKVGKSVRNTQVALRGLEEKGAILRVVTKWHGGSNQWKINYPLVLGPSPLCVIDEEDQKVDEVDPPATLEELSTGVTDSSPKVVGVVMNSSPGVVMNSSPPGDEFITPKESGKEPEKDSHPPTPGGASARVSNRAGSEPGAAASSLALQGVRGADATGKEEEEEEVFAAWRNAGHPQPLARPVREELAELTALHGSSQVVSAIADSACSSKTTPGRAYLPHVRKLLSPQALPSAEAAWQFCPHCGQGYQEGSGHEERCPRRRRA